MNRHLLLLSLFLIPLCLPAVLLAGPGEVAPGKGPEAVLDQPEVISKSATAVTLYAYSRRPGAAYDFGIRYNNEAVDIPYRDDVTAHMEGVETIVAEFDLSSLGLTSGDTLAWIFTVVDEANAYTATGSTYVE